MSSDFRTANERLNRFASMDSNLLSKRLAEQSIQEAYEIKLTAALDAGRTYGLRQEKYDHILKKQLNKQHAQTEKMWDGVKM